jgi:acyl carrier protein
MIATFRLARRLEMASVREKVVELVFDVCRPHRPDVGDSGRPLLSSGLDSLDFASLLMAVEDHFKVTVADSDLENLASIDDFVKFLEDRKAA